MREFTLCVCVFVCMSVYVCVCVWQYQTDVTVICGHNAVLSSLMRTPLLLWASPVIPFPRSLLPSFTSPSTSSFDEGSNGESQRSVGVCWLSSPKY